ncbi:hypothetical protein [Marivirga sp.]|uniref:hypothetical protein n=1 Tax=Marivirga sp. TaxID=2018662 RepID=UPI0025F2E32D|nr:hypothetical protein [Marivirga sp.]
MSSHHIIRDEQEPPVLVFQLNGNWEELLELLGWSPILLINPILKETFEIKQTKFDGLLINEYVTVIEGNHDLVYSDDNLSDELLKWIELKNCTAINIFCNDKIMMDLFQRFKSKPLPVPLIFFTEIGKYILKPDSIFKKWYPEEFKIGIINDDIKKTRNLKQEQGGYWVEKAGFVRVEVEGNLVLIKEK